MMDASLLVALCLSDKSVIKGGGTKRLKRWYPGVAIWSVSRLYNLLY